MWRKLVRDFRAGRVDAADLDKARHDPFRAFRLDDAVGVRPSMLRYELPLDDAFLVRMARAIDASPHAGKRLGTEWMPRSATGIAAKDDVEQTWATHEELKIWNDTCTKWCTRKFFPDAVARVNMVLNVIRLYERLRALVGLKAQLVFKGGVMIRLVILEFLNDLPLAARLAATRHLEAHKALSVSDFDFEMVAEDHNLPDADVHKLVALDYAVLLWMLARLEHEVAAALEGSPAPKGNSLLTLGWDVAAGEAELKTMLQEAVDDVKEGSLKGARVDAVVIGSGRALRGHRTKSGTAAPAARKNVVVFGRNDKFVMPADELFTALGVRGVPAGAGGDWLYATLNTYIGETEPVARAAYLRGVFHLARIKCAFVVYYTTAQDEKRCDRLGGEVIDLSQSHGVKLDAMHAEMYAAVARPYADYPLLGVGDVTIRSNSVEGFYFDHGTMLHNTEVECWEVKKKEKRMARYAAFFVAHVLSPNVAGAPGAKRRALARVCDTLRTGTPCRTGVPVVDAFGARELQAVRSAPAAARRAYLRTLHDHVAALLGDESEEEEVLSLDETILPLLHQHIFSE